jgi:hypothetical protein
MIFEVDGKESAKEVAKQIEQIKFMLNGYPHCCECGVRIRHSMFKTHIDSDEHFPNTTALAERLVSQLCLQP